MCDIETEISEAGLDFFSIIIPYKNESVYMEACLKRLLDQDFNKEKYEIILVDDMSADNPPELVREENNIHIIKGDGRGPYTARNIGAAHSRGRILLFTDADCLVQKNWIRQYSEVFKNKNVELCFGPIHFNDSNGNAILKFMNQYVSEKFEYDFSSLDPLCRAGSAGNMAVRKKAFFRMKSFEECRRGGDLAFTQKYVRKYGRNGSAFIKQNPVVHLEADTLKKSLLKNAIYGKTKSERAEIRRKQPPISSSFYVFGKIFSVQPLKLKVSVIFMLPFLVCLRLFYEFPFLFGLFSHQSQVSRTGKKNENISVETICQFIWSLEKKYNLYDRKIKNIFWWQILRMDLYYRLTSASGLYESPYQIKKSFSEKIRYYLTLISEIILNNPLFSTSKKSNAVLPLDRSSGGEDFFTRQLIQEMNRDCVIINSPDKHKDGNYISLRGIKILINLLSGFFSILTVPVKGKLCEDLDREFFEKYQVKLNISRLVRRRVFAHLISKKFYMLIWKKNSIKCLYLVCSYYNYDAIHAAKELGIKTVELQHGLITPYHMGYSFPSGVSRPYLPDEIWMFGKFWKEAVHLPASVSYRIIGAPYIRQLSRNITKKDQSLVVFTSQGVIGRRLFEIAVQFAELKPDMKVVFRLHPNESLGLYNSAENLPANFRISEREPNIFELLASANYQVSVFSSTIFEGIYMGNRIILIDLPGIENVRFLSERYGIPVVREAGQIEHAMKVAKLLYIGKDFYSDPVEKLI